MARAALAYLPAPVYPHGMTSLEYLYRDNDIFAVYKPAGIHSVRAGLSGGPSIADSLLAEAPSLAEVGTTGVDAGLVTRLDRSTSGILLGAFSPTVWSLLHQQVLAGEIEKRYVAYVQGRFPDQHSITSFIGSPHRGAKKMKIYERKPAKSARALEGTSHCRLLSYDARLDISLVEITASPARRHQIRAHAAYLGHPLVGDSLYGSHRALPLVLREQRDFFLHAYRITLTHPITAVSVTVESPYEENDKILLG